jgi:hypothetical protein
MVRRLFVLIEDISRNEMSVTGEVRAFIRAKKDLISLEQRKVGRWIRERHTQRSKTSDSVE